MNEGTIQQTQAALPARQFLQRVRRAANLKKEQAMTRAILPIGWTIFFLVSVGAQDRPRVEVFGGFSHAAIRAPQDHFTAKGWHAMIAVNSRQSWLEFVADFSGHYGSINRVPTHTYIALAGVRFSYQHGRLIGYTHSLYGLSFGRPPLITSDDFERSQRVWFTFVPSGGGMDIVLHQRVAVRLFQVDVIVHSETPPDLQGYQQSSQTGSSIQLRLSTGIVFRFGKI